MELQLYPMGPAIVGLAMVCIVEPIYIVCTVESLSYTESMGLVLICVVESLSYTDPMGLVLVCKEEP